MNPNQALPKPSPRKQNGEADVALVESSRDYGSFFSVTAIFGEFRHTEEIDMRRILDFRIPINMMRSQLTRAAADCRKRARVGVMKLAQAEKDPVKITGPKLRFLKDGEDGCDLGVDAIDSAVKP